MQSSLGRSNQLPEISLAAIKPVRRRCGYRRFRARSVGSRHRSLPAGQADCGLGRGRPLFPRSRIAGRLDLTRWWRIIHPDKIHARIST